MTLIANPARRIALTLTLTCAAVWLTGCAALSGGEQVKHNASEKAVSHETVFFDSEAVGRPMRFEVILPFGYEQSDKRYPTLYLLHGFGGDSMQWTLNGVLDYAADYDMIVVLPDAGNSDYVNWAVSEDGKKNNWEDLIIRDIVGYVDSHYRTIARREGRAIGGLSMGGDGATVIGLRHPDMFCSIASHSGSQGGWREVRERLAKGEPPSPVEPRPDWLNYDFDIPGFGTYEERTPVGRIVTTEEEADAIDARKLVLQVPADQLPDIYITCGTEDFLWECFEAMTQIMRDNGIAHTAKQSSGGHTFEYWTREVRFSMAHQYQVMEAALEGLAQGG